jgi:hypothetical protein
VLFKPPKGVEKDGKDDVKLNPGWLKEDEKLVGVAELDKLNPVPVGPELIEAFVGKPKGKLEELDTLLDEPLSALLDKLLDEPLDKLLDELLQELEEDVSCAWLLEDVADALTVLLPSPR